MTKPMRGCFRYAITNLGTTIYYKVYTKKLYNAILNRCHTIKSTISSVAYMTTKTCRGQ